MLSHQPATRLAPPVGQPPSTPTPHPHVAQPPRYQAPGAPTHAPPGPHPPPSAPAPAPADPAKRVGLTPEESRRKSKEREDSARLLVTLVAQYCKPQPERYAQFTRTMEEFKAQVREAKEKGLPMDVIRELTRRTAPIVGADNFRAMVAKVTLLGFRPRSRRCPPPGGGGREGGVHGAWVPLRHGASVGVFRSQTPPVRQD